MPIIVHVALPAVCFDPQLHFRSNEGQQVLDFFKSGALLRIPELSSPHNWALEHPDGRCVQFTHHAFMARALKELAAPFQPTRPFSRSPLVAGGSAEHAERVWAFDEKGLAALSERWARAEECAADWSNHKGRLVKEPRGLGMMAQATLRYLKQRYAMCLHPELFGPWMELNAQGLIDVNPNGGVCLAADSKDLVVSPGMALMLKYPSMRLS